VRSCSSGFILFSLFVFRPTLLMWLLLPPAWQWGVSPRHAQKKKVKKEGEEAFVTTASSSFCFSRFSLSLSNMCTVHLAVATKAAQVGCLLLFCSFIRFLSFLLVLLLLLLFFSLFFLFAVVFPRHHLLLRCLEEGRVMIRLEGTSLFFFFIIISLRRCHRFFLLFVASYYIYTRSLSEAAIHLVSAEHLQGL
jgi:hypothetical protein